MKNPPLSLVILMEEGAQTGKEEKALSSVDLVGASRDGRQLWRVIVSDQLLALRSYENLHQPGAL